MSQCAKCGTEVRGGPFYSPLGESVCAGCHDTIAGAVLGTMTGGGIAEAVALGRTKDGKPAGILGWIRRALGNAE
jgi:hypothetical protein